MKLGKEDGGIRTMPQAKLLKTLPVIEKQLDALLAFDATSNELVNSVLRVAHLHLYRDLIRLYAVYNEAMINLIGRYFTMTKRDCRTALVIYKAFLKRMEAMNAFVKIAEATDSSSFAPPHENDSITFQPVPPSVLEALEQHLSYLENHKPPESSSTRATGTSDGTLTNSKLGATAGDFGGSQDNDVAGSAWSPGHAGSSDFVLTEKERMHIIEEERARLESFVSNARKQAQSNAETEMRTSVDLLTKLSTDAEFVDLLTSHDSNSDLVFPDTANSSWPVAPTQSSNDAWSVPAESAVTQQKQTTSGELALLAPPPASMVSSNPFLLSPASGPFTSTVPSSLHPAVNAWSTIQSQYMPFGLPANNTRPPIDFEADFRSRTPTCVPGETTGTTQNDATSVPSSNGPTSSALDARLAQLAGNLTVTGDSPAASYRAPDGSVTAVKWTGTSQILRPSTNPVQTSSMRNSASLNQLTGPAVSPASGPTNPWYSPAPTMNQVYPKVPIPTTAYASMYQQWPQAHPNAAQSNPFSAISSNTTVHSTNPFL
ncbi:leucine aminopeptidase/pepditase M28/metalloprotease, variant 2 [Clonorchis sinensis]|uniref:Leucine aminopeptidase/pepditase M28/metalloprotease, variant 2 n=1 Tax=Clonorchis sinensis TaxID=79923 RepID=A0A8T1N0U5_CLOSI|nr:leucine aminopeptidase/pepditase M28/metalloprotease, variant 2 [Clonorchis sinensis]